MSTDITRQLQDALKRYWGYSEFRPLQQAAMEAVLADRDSSVILPTGGGKSLCFQVPAVCRDGLAIVVSPLISLMKDQVDALRNCGVSAAEVNSSLDAHERQRVAEDIRAGTIKLLYVAPERLMMDRTIRFLQSVPVSFIAIDEAHCISEWGHNFRPEYRMLNQLREFFPDVALHAYTATATPAVRQDIIHQLQLRDPELLVGSFDRPNLIYRVQRRGKGNEQILTALKKHRDEPGIIYCISRKQVDELCRELKQAGYAALPYHAGLDSHQRNRNQDAFLKDDAQVIVATVAFGMGVDKSNVRFVIHAGMPKSIEAYQQESGRAGRDGLEAVCYLLYSGGDYALWQRLLDETNEAAHKAAVAMLSAMFNFCSSPVCRHESLVRYFGEDWTAESCGACDVCLGEIALIKDALVVAQKILSCVVRLKQFFGSDYTTKVLIGSQEQKILERGHQNLSTYGLLKENGKQAVRGWIEQLISQGYLAITGEYRTLSVTETGWQVLKEGLTPRLAEPVKVSDESPAKSRSSSREAADWDGVDRDLFTALKRLRREISEEEGVPAYIVFGDASLRDMARLKPVTHEEFRNVKGVGEKKLATFADAFIAEILLHTDDNP